MMVFNHKTAPDLPVVWAVRMSMSIPMVWPEVEWQSEWGAYLGREITGHLLVDGGLLSNFPIELFISDDDHIVEMMGQKKSGNVLGLLIDETKEVAGVEQAAEAGGLDFSQLKLIQRLSRLINTATKAHDKMVIEAFEDQVVRLPAKGFGTTEFDMTDERREALVAAGRQAMDAHLELYGDVSFSLEKEPYFEIDVAEHADKVANQILAW